MKKLALSLLVALAAIFNTQAQANSAADIAQAIMLADLQNSISSELHTNNLINWKVGEYTDYEMSAIFGNMGNMTKKATAEEGNAIWIKSEVSGMMGNQTTEALIDRADGHIIKFKQDGKDTQIPDDKLEIISQDHTTVTVPAGTFETIHIVAKSEKIKKLEMWANPRDVTLDGGVQMVIDAGMITVTMKLTKFGGR